MVPRGVRVAGKQTPRVWLVLVAPGNQSWLDRQAILGVRGGPSRPSWSVGGHLVWLNDCGGTLLCPPPLPLSCQCCELTGCVGCL